MNALSLEIPANVLVYAKIPRPQLQVGLKRELALQLYRENIVSFAAAHRLAGMSKIEFHYLLGERKIPRQYDETEYEKDLETIQKMGQDQ